MTMQVYERCLPKTNFQFIVRSCPVGFEDEKAAMLLFSMICFRHTEEMIQKLESAGLGYHVSADETEDKLGMMVNSNVQNINCVPILAKKYNMHSYTKAGITVIAK